MSKESSIMVSEDIVEKVRVISGQPIELCYLCAECSSSCPMANYMSLPPHSMMSMLKKGMVDQLFASRDFLYCLGCHLCSVRCPNDIEVGKVMKALVAIYLEQAGMRKSEKALVSELYNKGVINPILLAIKSLNLKDIMSETPRGIRMLIKTGIPHIPKPSKDYLNRIRRVLENIKRTRGGE